jgi:hypothetical protein
MATGRPGGGVPWGSFPIIRLIKVLHKEPFFVCILEYMLAFMWHSKNVLAEIGIA